MILSLSFQKSCNAFQRWRYHNEKAVGFLAAVLAIASVLTACSARSPISADDFQKAAQDAGYEVTQDASYGSDAASLVASKSDSDVQITFTVFPDAITAKQKYASQKKEFSGIGRR
jgi:archaellum component FlaG (FlaF/FlaG flagellin family)